MTLTVSENGARNPQVLLNQFNQVIQDLVRIFAEENEIIRTFTLNQENQSHNTALIHLKSQKAEHLQDLLKQIFEARDAGAIDAAQMIHVNSTYGIFFKKLEENLAYLDLAESLNHKILSFFIDTHNDLTAYSYSADGAERAASLPQAAAFICKAV